MCRERDAGCAATPDIARNLPPGDVGKRKPFVQNTGLRMLKKGKDRLLARAAQKRVHVLAGTKPEVLRLWNERKQAITRRSCWICLICMCTEISTGAAS